MSDKRIIEYETATTLADDDYILLDSETGGTCKIKAKKLEPPPTEPDNSDLYADHNS